MPDPNCPQCDALEAQVQAAGRRAQALENRTAPLRDELQRGLQADVDRLQTAMAERMQIEAEHAALVQAAAVMTGEIAKMTGAGATAVAGFNPADVSRQPRDGWIAVEVGNDTLWFRSAEAQAAYMRASGLAAALDNLARLQARRDEALERVRQANDRENAARDALDRAEERANARLRDHIQSIRDADAERERLHQAWLRCKDRCARGTVEDQRVGLAGIGMMLVGMVMIAVGNPFGAGEGQAAGQATATASASATTSTATAVATTVTGAAAPKVGPISAVFDQPSFTTTYTLPVTGVPSFKIDWSGADCGAWGPDGPTRFRWNHPHPPCDTSTDHRDRTIVAVVQAGDARFTCRYQGAASGTGGACTGGGSGGTTATPGAGGGSTASPTASATPTTGAGTGGGTGGATPTVSATPQAGGGTTTSGGGTGGTVTGGGGQPSSPGTTLAGAALTAAGGAAAGYATSRRRGNGQTAEREGAPPEGERQPDPPPLTQPRITVSGSGDSVTKDRPFTITVETPRPATGDPPETIEVKLRSVETGKEETVTLRWNGGTRGPVRYESNPLTLEHGGEGRGRTTVFGLEFSRGGMGRGLSGTPNGTDIVVSTGGSETRVTAYTTWVQEGVGHHVTAIRQYGEFWRNVAMNIQNLPDSEGKRELLTRARIATRLAGQAIRVENSDWLDTRKLTNLQAILGLLQGGATHDPRDEYRSFRAADEAAHTLTQDIFWRGIAGATIGLYRTIAEVSGAGAAYTVFTGRDIMDRKVGWDERLFAALDLAGRLTIFGQTRAALGSALDSMAMGEVRAVATEVRAATSTAQAEAQAAERARDAAASAAYAERQAMARAAQGHVPVPAAAAGAEARVGTSAREAYEAIRNDANATQAAKDAAASAAYAERQAAGRQVRTLVPDNPVVTGPQGKALLGAPQGTPVAFTEDFGMLRNRARHFQSVAERYNVRIRVRPANVESLESMARGNPPKHVKIKSKTINGLDEVLGAPENSQGLVGYFDPKPVVRSAEVEAQYAKVLGRQPTNSDWAKLEKRFQQRAEEFRDQAAAMEHLEHDGLIRRENGLVVDTGLSNTRLQNGELVHGNGPRTGTGRAFSGDHDMWDITRPDGSPVDAATKARVEANLMDGSARTQHGPHKDWKPTTDVDRGIDERIRSSHMGQTNPDGSVTPAQRTFTNPDGSTDVVRGEALVEFKPGDQPRVSYETGQAP